MSIKNKDDKDTFKIIAKCDPNAKTPQFTTDTANNQIIILSDGNCGVYVPLAKLLQENKYIICTFMIVIGIVLLFFGGSKWDTLLTIIGFIVGASGILMLIFGFIQVEPSTKNYIIMGFIALIVGIMVAALCKTFVLLSYFLLGFLGGYSLSLYILMMCRYHGPQWGFELTKWGSAVLLGVICLLV